MRALLSVSDKTGLAELARGLASHGCELISTGGTARFLRQTDLPVVDVEAVTGMPEMMDGRVKTLHPAIHAGILARRGHPADRDDLSRHGIQPIDIVVVNLYPFQQAAARPETQVAELVEEIDIGGPSLLRAAAKNFAHVLVLVDPADYAEAVSALAGPSDARGALHLRMARKAFAHTSRYDGVVAAALDAVDAQGDGAWVRVPPTDLAPPLLSVRAERIRALRYGENPHQEAAWYAGPQPVGFSGARLVQGKAPSYTNLLDLDAAARLVLEFEEPAAVVVKHTNPCGMAVATTPAAAYGHARDADPMSAFGGIVGVNRTIDAELARALVSTFIEAIVAPGVDADAAAILSTKPAVRLLTADFAAVALRGDQEIRSILGGWLVQRRDAVDEARAPWEGATRDPDIRVVTKRAPTADEWRALRFAWRVCAHVKSNAVIFTRTDRTVGIGAGQMSRVDAVRVATMKATSSLEGSVAPSDAFFPFRDGLDALASAGATAVVQPGGSVRDPEVIAAADEHGLAMVFTGRRHFRH